MAKLYVVDMESKPHEIEASPNGASIMSILLAKGFDVGLCGGNCSCGTCCAVIDAEWLGKLRPCAADESALLHQADTPEPGRRLTCQLAFVEALDGIGLRLASME